MITRRFVTQALLLFLFSLVLPLTSLPQNALAVPAASNAGKSVKSGNAANPSASTLNCLQSQTDQAIAHVNARVLADMKSIVPGVPFKIGVEFTTDPHWHIYYKENGDAGMPTTIEWTLPEGFKASDLEWEKPTRFNDTGIITYGYDGKTVIAATITPPAKPISSKNVCLVANIKWLACKDQCIPGKAQLSLTMPTSAVGTAPVKENTEVFSKVGFKGKVGAEASSSSDPNIKPVSQISANAPGADAALAIDSPPPVDDSAIDSPPPVASDPAAAPVTPATSLTPVSSVQSGKTTSILDANLNIQGAGQTDNLAMVLLLAFVGGFILNFMPCVLPVISIKVLSFMQQAGEDPKRVFQLGLTFTAGIVSSFLALAGIVVGLQQAGQRIGWGFQFQYPLFVFAMACVILFFALSMFGLFYIQVTAGQAQVDKLAAKEGLSGTFFKGVLATILSTPCTAPALGSALGFAFAQPWWVIVLVFFTVSLGMSFPYVILTANPGWMKYMPKPGVWMEKFKEGMGFLMLATVIWLLYVLGQQVGTTAAISAAGFLVVLSFVVWIVGRFTDLTSTGKRKAIVYAIAGGITVVGFQFLLAPYPQLLTINPAVGTPDNKQPQTPLHYANNVTVPDGGEGIKWEPFTIEKLDANLSAGKTVFVDFTADWCLTCKVNESQVINTPPVLDKFKALNVVTMRADWTHQDDQITALLKKFGRSGVPLYVIFPGNNPTAPIVLPEVVTQQIVVDDLTKAGASK